MIDSFRGTGRTTTQLKNLPARATFFWYTNDTYYPKALAKKLNREDIKVYPRSSLANPHKFYGLAYFKFALDHATSSFMSLAEWDGLIDLRERERARNVR
jgi:hypothetical protein